MRCAVAIVIVTYNSRSLLPELFASLDAFTNFADVQLIVVDNASADGTLAALFQAQEELPDLPLDILPQTRNTGFAGGCNIGIARARALGARYVQLLNPDTVVAPGWLERVRRVLDARPEVAAAQPLVLLHGEPELVNSAGNSIHFCGFGYCSGYRQRRDAVTIDRSVNSVPYASGAALLLRLSALDEVGDFDETLFLYHEDCDLQIRLRLAGYECVLVPEAHIFHKYKADFSPQKYGWLERNRHLVLIKDWPRRELLVAAPALLGVEAAVLLFALRSGFLPQKLWAYREVLRHLPATLAQRRQVQARRRNSTFTRHLTGEMALPDVEHPLIERVANPLLSAYLALCRATILRDDDAPKSESAMDTASDEYARRLETLSGARWKRWLDVQAPYRRHLLRLRLGFTLDIGCGIGRNLLHLSGHGVGVDHNPQSVALARARGLAAYEPAAFFAQPEHRPERFDSLLFSHVAEHMHFDEAVALLRSYLPFLRPGGQVVVLTPQEAGFRADPTHVEFFDFARSQALLSAVGVEPVRSYSFPFPRLVGKLFPHNEFVVIGQKPLAAHSVDTEPDLSAATA
jgi:GT2 family glycosyltransferase/SAM-dependent methyltransferase